MKKLLMLFALSMILIATTGLASAYTYYGPSYSDTYYKQVTYTPYGTTTEIHQDTPTKTMHYTSTTRDYYGGYYSPYSNPVYNYWSYGPSSYYYRPNYYPSYGYYNYPYNNGYAYYTYRI